MQAQGGGRVAAIANNEPNQHPPSEDCVEHSAFVPGQGNVELHLIPSVRDLLCLVPCSSSRFDTPSDPESGADTESSTTNVDLDPSKTEHHSGSTEPSTEEKDQPEHNLMAKVSECFQYLGFSPPRHISYLASGQYHDVYRIKVESPDHQHCNHIVSRDLVLRTRRDFYWKHITEDADNPGALVDKEFKDQVALAMLLRQKRMGPPVYFFDATGNNALGRSFMISRYCKGTMATAIFDRDDEPGIQLQKGVIASAMRHFTRAEMISFDAAGRIHAAFDCDKGCTRCIERSTQQHALVYVRPLDADLVDRFHLDSANCLLTQIDNVLHSRLLDCMQKDKHNRVPFLLALWYTLVDIQDMMPPHVTTGTSQPRPVLVLTDASPYNTILSTSAGTVHRSIFIDPDDAVAASPCLNTYKVEVKDDDDDVYDLTQCDDRAEDSNICPRRCRFQPRARNVPTTADLDVIDNPWQPLQLEVMQDMGQDSSPGRLSCATLTRRLLLLYQDDLVYPGSRDMVRKLHWHSGLIKWQWAKHRGPLHFRYVVSTFHHSAWGQGPRLCVCVAPWSARISQLIETKQADNRSCLRYGKHWGRLMGSSGCRFATGQEASAA